MQAVTIAVKDNTVSLSIPADNGTPGFEWSMALLEDDPDFQILEQLKGLEQHQNALLKGTLTAIWNDRTPLREMAVAKGKTERLNRILLIIIALAIDSFSDKGISERIRLYSGPCAPRVNCQRCGNGLLLWLNIPLGILGRYYDASELPDGGIKELSCTPEWSRGTYQAALPALTHHSGQTSLELFKEVTKLWPEAA